MGRRLKVAVIVPTIPGRERLLSRALASVNRQTYRPTQVIVVHDAERTGAAHTRNRGLARVGINIDLIAWLDDDDEFMSHHIKVCVRAFDNDLGVDLVYPTPRLLPPGTRDPTATSLNGNWVLPWGIQFGLEQERHMRLHGNFIPITHLVRAEKVREVGGFPIPGTPEWPRPNVEDWGYMIRLLDAGARFHHVNRVTWLWHVHATHTGGEPTR